MDGCVSALTLPPPAQRRGEGSERQGSLELINGVGDRGGGVAGKLRVFLQHSDLDAGQTNVRRMAAHIGLDYYYPLGVGTMKDVDAVKFVSTLYYQTLLVLTVPKLSRAGAGREPTSRLG